MMSPKDYALTDAKRAREEGIDPHDAHAPYTLAFSGVTICCACSRNQREARRWWQWFKETQVRWPCAHAKESLRV